MPCSAVQNSLPREALTCRLLVRPRGFASPSWSRCFPTARILARRPYSWLGGAHYGLGLKEGEKLLIVASGIEPLVVQALVVAAQEMGVTTDVIARDVAALTRRMGREEFDYERFDPSRL